MAKTRVSKKSAKTEPPISKIPEIKTSTNLQWGFLKATDTIGYDFSKVIVPTDYNPLKDNGGFMNPVMIKYFLEKLKGKKAELAQQNQDLKNVGDFIAGKSETMEIAEARRTNNERITQIAHNDKLLRKLDYLISSIITKGPESDYGYSKESGVPIPLARLMAQPWATRTVEEQQEHDRLGALYRNGKRPEARGFKAE